LPPSWNNRSSKQSTWVRVITFQFNNAIAAITTSDDADNDSAEADAAGASVAAGLHKNNSQPALRTQER
jgi:hypothetical protein